LKFNYKELFALFFFFTALIKCNERQKNTIKKNKQTRKNLNSKIAK